MPTYEYQCNICNKTTKKRHSIKERLTDCPECNSADSLRRLLGDFMIINKKESGKLVKSFIEDSKKELKAEKKRLKGQEY